ncbi:hypothetical protein B296_00046324 [Ensete ventricosum]|uniref:Uncharacterized protein n=1 Tax=Ensete ventricosum TaxID=4639 RepID=A0A426X7G7_ENSVE|nr:hypothetical protein B296_00046324 [Ensete ventricosum]
MLLQLGRSVNLKGSERSATVVDLLSFDSEKELIADGVRKVSLLVGADATVVVHKEDGLVRGQQLWPARDVVATAIVGVRGSTTSIVTVEGEDEKAAVVKACFPFFLDFRTTMLRSLLWRCRDGAERDLHRREAAELLLWRYQQRANCEPMVGNNEADSVTDASDGNGKCQRG